MNELIINGIYKHFKGNFYKVLYQAIDSESGQAMVVYQALYGSYAVFVRPLDMFLSEVDHDKYPKVKQKYRFELAESKDVLDKIGIEWFGTCAANPVKVPKLTIESIKDAVKLTKDLTKLDTDGVEYLQLKLLNNKE